MRLARGHFEEMVGDGSRVSVRGWIVVPESEADSIRALVDDVAVAQEAPSNRPDVQAAYPRIPHAARAGFHFRLEASPVPSRLTVQALRGDQPVGEIRTLLRRDLDQTVPAPPESLLARTTGSPRPEYYRAEGLRAFSAFREAIEAQRPLSSFGRMLDWGCGAGRTAVHFLLDGSVPEIAGCDIDAEAIEWCRRHLPAGRFEVSGPEPPLPFGDGELDLVIASSVFTHLRRDMQLVWLDELRRVLAPAGLLAASVHGDFAARLHLRNLPPLRGLRQRLRWRARGFFDLGEDPRLGAAAPAGYYRAVFQSRTYTLARWARGFDIVDYRPAALQAHQDLVVLRRA